MKRFLLFLSFIFVLAACAQPENNSQPTVSPNPENIEPVATAVATDPLSPTSPLAPTNTPTADDPYALEAPNAATDNEQWAYEETFDGDPTAPAQNLFPPALDFSVTHRTHPKEHFRQFESYLADHASDCAGPNPEISPLPQHLVTTSHTSNSTNPDPSFFICKNHLMSSMGHVEAYSVTSFWPRQEFNFAQGGILEFDVNINDEHIRSWFEVMIIPRNQLKVGAAPEGLPIDETYPTDRIVLRHLSDNKRQIHVGTGAIDPEGVIVKEHELSTWRSLYPNDPANDDRRIRRTMRITFEPNQITWGIEKADGEFDNYTVSVPGGLPFSQGLVVFKTHAYTPEKVGNVNAYTFHWDNIRFTGPVTGQYESFEATDVVYLQHNGDRPIGDKASNSVNLPYIGDKPVLFGQVHNPMQGQVLLSVNGRANIEVNPYDYNPGVCSSTGWKSFQVPIDPSWLNEGNNTFTWTVGPRPDCVREGQWNGFSIMGLEIQFDLPDTP